MLSTSDIPLRRRRRSSTTRGGVIRAGAARDETVCCVSPRGRGCVWLYQYAASRCLKVASGALCGAAVAVSAQGFRCRRQGNTLQWWCKCRSAAFGAKLDSRKKPHRARLRRPRHFRVGRLKSEWSRFFLLRASHRPDLAVSSRPAFPCTRIPGAHLQLLQACLWISCHLFSLAPSLLSCRANIDFDTPAVVLAFENAGANHRAIPGCGFLDTRMVEHIHLEDVEPGLGLVEVTNDRRRTR